MILFYSLWKIFVTEELIKVAFNYYLKVSPTTPNLFFSSKAIIKMENADDTKFKGFRH